MRELRGIFDFSAENAKTEDCLADDLVNGLYAITKRQADGTAPSNPFRSANEFPKFLMT